MTIFKNGYPADFLPLRKILTNQREVQYRKHHRRLQAVMDASGADKLILLVQTNQVYDKYTAVHKVKDALKKGDIGRLVLRLVSILSVLLIYYAVAVAVAV